MPAARKPFDEERRLAALDALQVLDSASEAAFDSLTALASEIAGAPIALISLLDRERQWFKARVGLEARETPREQAFCGYTILSPEPLAVADATEDPRFADNPLVTGAPDIRAYLGVPLIGDAGDAFGTLCVIDRKRVDWTGEQIAAVERLAGIAVQMLEWRASALASERTSRRHQELSDRLEKVVALSGVGGWEYDPEVGRPNWGAQTRRIHEVDEDYTPDLETALDFYPPEARPVITEALERCLENGEPWDLELPFITAKGRRIFVRTLGERVVEEGRPTRLRGVFQDISQAREREEALRQAEAEAEAARIRLWSAIEAIPDGFVVYDAEDRLVAANRRYKEIYAASAPAIEIGARFEDILRCGLENGQYPEAEGWEAEWLAERLRLHRTPKRAIEQELPGERWLQIHESICDNGDIVGFRVDVTETKRAQRRLQEYSTQLESAKALAERRNRELLEANAIIARNALNDPLTGLPNRRRFEEALEESAARCERTGEALALLHVDLDRFKQVNDTLGHAAGDEVLKTAAKRLRDAIRRDDLAARLGGDEFVVLGCVPRESNDLPQLGERIVLALSEPVYVEGERCDVGASVGSAVAMGSKIDGAALLRSADMALYQAKEAGRGRAVHFDDALMDRRAAQRRRAMALGDALEDGRVFAALRPVRGSEAAAPCANLASGRWLTGCGALEDERAWRGVERQAVLAERADLAVIEAALQAARPCPVAPLFVEAGLEALRAARTAELAAGSPAPLIIAAPEVELERVAPGVDRERLLAALQRLRRAGGDLAVRDFGAGSGGMAALALWSPKQVFLARSVVREAGESETGRRIAAALIAGAGAVGATCAAVAKDAEREVLRRLGCAAFIEPSEQAAIDPAALSAATA